MYIYKYILLRGLQSLLKPKIYTVYIYMYAVRIEGCVYIYSIYRYPYIFLNADFLSLLQPKLQISQTFVGIAFIYIHLRHLQVLHLFIYAINFTKNNTIYDILRTSCLYFASKAKAYIRNWCVLHAFLNTINTYYKWRLLYILYTIKGARVCMIYIYTYIYMHALYSMWCIVYS